MSDPVISKERKFLHDIASPMAIIGLSMRKMRKELLSDPESSSKDKQLKTIEKIIAAVEKLEILHSDHKDYLS